MKKYNVHVYAVVRVKVCGIEADSHEDAITKADEELETALGRMFPDMSTNLPPEACGDVLHFELAGYDGEVLGYLVDEENDPEFIRTRRYKEDGKTPDIPAEFKRSLQ